MWEIAKLEPLVAGALVVELEPVVCAVVELVVAPDMTLVTVAVVILPCAEGLPVDAAAEVEVVLIAAAFVKEAAAEVKTAASELKAAAADVRAARAVGCTAACDSTAEAFDWMGATRVLCATTGTFVVVCCTCCEADDCTVPPEILTDISTPARAARTLLVETKFATSKVEPDDGRSDGENESGCSKSKKLYP